ncbi:MAG: hypothetical protein R2793_06035 [Flavobacteriaceae bacterium]
MKPFLSIVLLATLLIPTLGALAWFQFQERTIKKEVLAKLRSFVDESDLTLIVLSEKEATKQLHWKHNSEFSYQGFLYDVVKKKREGDHYYFWCLKDDKETLLHKKIDELVMAFLGQDPHQQEKSKHLNWFLESLFFSKNEPWAISKRTFISKKTIYSYSFNEQSIAIVPVSPPPQRS